MHTSIGRCWRSLAVLIPAALSGCGTGNTVEGKVDGQALSVREAVFFDQSTGTDPEQLLVLMSDRPGLCDAVKAGTGHIETTYFIIELDQLVTPIGPWTGDYVVKYFDHTIDKFAYSVFQRYEASCAFNIQDSVHSGTVSLTEYKEGPSGVMRGTFDLLFNETDAVKGSFDVHLCNAPAANVWSLIWNCQ